jgi:hypothetical protein
MFPLLAGFALIALAVAPRGRGRGLGALPALPSGDAVEGEVVDDLPRASTVYLVEPALFVHPAKRESVAARGTDTGSRWLVVPSSGWAGGKPFATARQARTVLKAAGFKGPYGHGAATRWVR